MYSVGDIVKFKFGKGQKDGLHEVTSVYEGKSYQYYVTNDACNSEYTAKHDDLILVCTYGDRRDLD